MYKLQTAKTTTLHQLTRSVLKLQLVHCNLNLMPPPLPDNMKIKKKNKVNEVSGDVSSIINTRHRKIINQDFS
jgi:hypothetical protein